MTKLFIKEKGTEGRDDLSPMTREQLLQLVEKKGMEIPSDGLDYSTDDETGRRNLRGLLRAKYGKPREQLKAVETTEPKQVEAKTKETRKGLPLWAWALIALIVAAAIFIGWLAFRPRPAATDLSSIQTSLSKISTSVGKIDKKVDGLSDRVAVLEEPVVEEPVVEEPVGEESVDEESMAEEPVDEELVVVEEPVVPKALEKTELEEIAVGVEVFADLYDGEVSPIETTLNDGESLALSIDAKSTVYVDGTALDLEYSKGKLLGIFNSTGNALTVGVETTWNTINDPNQWNVWGVVFKGTPEQFAYRVAIWQQGEVKPIYSALLVKEDGIDDITFDPRAVVQETQQIAEGFINLEQDRDVFPNLNDKESPILEKIVNPKHALVFSMGSGKVLVGDQNLTENLEDTEKLVSIYNDTMYPIKVVIYSEWNEGNDRWDVHPVYYLGTIEQVEQEVQKWYQGEPKETFLVITLTPEGIEIN